MERERDELVAVAAGVLNVALVAGKWAGVAVTFAVMLLVCYVGLAVIVGAAAYLLTRRAWALVMERHELADCLDQPIPYTLAGETTHKQLPVSPGTPEPISLPEPVSIDLGGYPGRDVDEMAERSAYDFLSVSTAPEEAWMYDDVPADTSPLPCCCSPVGGEGQVATMTSAAQTTVEAPARPQDSDQRYRDVLIGVEVGKLSVKASCKARGVPESSYRTWAKKQKAVAV